MKKLLVIFSILTGIVFGQQTGARYLIITHDDFYNDVLPLAQWKHKKGLPTKVAKLSETGSTSAQIRTYILNAYNNWSIKPKYLLLVGAPNYLPLPQVSGTYSDNYYTNMNGDIYNEILSGRLTVHSTTECQTVVNKILAYERTPEVGTDSTWFRDACLVIRQDGEYESDSIYWDDINFGAGTMLSAGFRQIDTLCNYWGDGSADILNSVNSGCGFVMYRGQGVGNWWSPFDVNPDQSANGNRPPIVLSYTCRTIGTGSTPATAERWLLTGLPSSLRGAAGYFATTTVISHGAHLRSAVSKGFFKGAFNGQWSEFGEACEAGRKEVYDRYPSSGGLAEYYGFTTLGDPAMKIWTATPSPITVVHDTGFVIGAETLSVTVSRYSVPVESALVCIHLDSTIYDTGYTSAAGEIFFNVSPAHPGYMDVTVTDRNLIPYEGQVCIYDTNPCLTLLSAQINDSLGNANGVPNNGETILLGVVLQNIGQGIARNVQAMIRTDDTLAFIIDSLSLYPDIQAFDSASNSSPFVLTIAPNCPDNHEIDIHMRMRDETGDTWPADLAITVRSLNGAIGPDPYGYYIYDDTDTLSGNAPVYDWFEIDPSAAGPGALVSEITDEDADTVTYPLPFIFKYYNLDYDSIGLCSNGFAELGRSTFRFGANTAIPRLGGPKRLLAPFWDDLSPNVNGDIAFYSDTLNHRWILEFKDCSHYDNNTNLETYQMILRDPQYYPTPTADGEIIFQYQQVTDATSNSVGFEDETESRGLEYLYENDYNPNAAPLATGRALLITTKPPNGGVPLPWLYLMNFAIRDSAGGNNNGIPEPGETIDLITGIKNNGDTTAHNVSGYLTTRDPDAAISDSLSGFGDIPASGMADNGLAPFRFQVAGSPGDSVIGFRLRLTAEDGGYEKWDYFTVYLYIRLAVDETGTIKTGLPGTAFSVFPNPFRGRIKFTIENSNANPDGSNGIWLSIYDVTGRLVKIFSLPATYSLLPTVVWDGTDQTGRNVPAGVYFARLKTDNGSQVKKIILIR